MAFSGGSAYTMAHDIGAGFVMVTERTFRKMTVPEMNQLGFEIDRCLRELRGSQLPTDERLLVQSRNRKILRLNSAMMVVRNYRQKARR